mgnify:CR=1 FL=1
MLIRTDELRRFWRHYLGQSLLATVAVLIVLAILRLEHAVITASIGSTAFIVFAMPRALTANARNVVGGHATGFVCGVVFALASEWLGMPDILGYACAVGLSIFVMVVTDTEHPPASGTALGIAMTGLSLDVTLTVFTSILLLAFIHFLLRPYLHDLV